MIAGGKGRRQRQEAEAGGRGRRQEAESGGRVRRQRQEAGSRGRGKSINDTDRYRLKIFLCSDKCWKYNFSSNFYLLAEMLRIFILTIKNH